jgi:hypothetical protein
VELVLGGLGCSWGSHGNSEHPWQLRFFGRGSVTRPLTRVTGIQMNPASDYACGHEEAS